MSSSFILLRCSNADFSPLCLVASHVPEPFSNVVEIYTLTCWREQSESESLPGIATVWDWDLAKGRIGQMQVKYFSEFSVYAQYAQRFHCIFHVIQTYMTTRHRFFLTVNGESLGNMFKLKYGISVNLSIM